MSYKDKNDFLLFPTRNGPTIGTSRERTMLDNCGGAEGIVRRVRENADGSTTLLRTRAGNPDFMTDETGSMKTCVGTSAVIDTGFVDTTYNFNGIGDETGGKLDRLVNPLGVIRPDSEVHIKDTHKWKDYFGQGAADADGVICGNMPSNFSGLMRRLMQVQHGATESKTSYQVPAGEECPVAGKVEEFSCRYVRTHGMFINSQGTRWIIEVDSTGIYRIPITFEKELTNNDVKGMETTIFSTYGTYDEAAAEIAKYWSITSFDRDKRVKFGDPPPCYADSGKAPWYGWCGWAFNYTGTAATICLAGQHPTEATWYMAYMYDITIGAAGDDEVPTYASCGLSASSTLAHNINDYDDNENAFLQVPATYPAYLSTISLHSPVSVSGQTIHAPIFSFYTENGSKKVYYFDLYASSPYNQTNTNPDATTVTITRTGDWTVGNFASGITSQPPDDLYTPISYTVAANTISNGTTSETYSGTRGGWGGFSGPSIPGQNNDYSGTKYYSGRQTGATGWASIGGYSNVHVVRLTAVYDNGDIYDRADLRPALYQYYALWMPVTTVVDYSTTGYTKIDYHKSTLLLPGYDRESVGFVHTTSEFNSAYVKSGSFPSSYGRVVPNGDMLGSRDGSPRQAWSEGSEDWGLYIPLDGMYGVTGLAVSHITGWYDWSALSGAVMGAANHVHESIDGPIMSVPGVYETVPEQTTTTRTLYLALGDQLVTYNVTHKNFHQTYFGGMFFKFWCGQSAFNKPGGKSYFYSPDISQKPLVKNLGSFTQAEKSLFGYIGVV